MAFRGKRCTYIIPGRVQAPYYRSYGKDITIMESDDLNIIEHDRIHVTSRRSPRIEMVTGLKRINLEDFL